MNNPIALSPDQRESRAYFSYRSPVYFDELDAMKMLHNTRYAVYIERATTALYHTFGRKWELEVEKNPDQFHVVREFKIEFLNLFLGGGELDIRLWVNKMGNTSCTYDFEVASEKGKDRTLHVQGHRTIIKLDPKSLRPQPWSEDFRIRHKWLIREPARVEAELVGRPE